LGAREDVDGEKIEKRIYIFVIKAERKKFWYLRRKFKLRRL
jgi:hypothetical protein